jgi:hypothetical protein
MAITVDEVKALAERWCDMLRREDHSVESRVDMFVHPDARIYILESGVSLTMAEHAAYHSQFASQDLALGDFTISQLSDQPERARALGSLYWEAHFADPDKPPLRCVVGEDWIVERIPSGELRFVLWLNTIHHFLAGSPVKAVEL